MEASALAHASRRGLLARRSPLLRLQGDDRLIALVRAGNDSAFEALWDRYRSRLLAYCRSIVRSTEDAEDVLQEVFVNAHAAMVADQREIQVRPWLYRIARNRSLNHLRKPVADGQDSMDVHIHAHGEDAHDKAERREKVRQLVADVKTLPETQRTALILREIDALSYDEIAQAMETTIPSVKSLLVRARVSLAEASESRLLTCDEVRVELAAAAEGLAKVNGPMRRHVRQCDGCGGFRKQLRADGKTLAALSPVGVLAIGHALFAKLFGGAAGGSAAGTSGAAGATGVAGAGAAGAGAAGAAGAAAGGGVLAAGTAGSGALLGGIGSAVGVKAAATAATAAIITAGAVEVARKPQTIPPPAVPVVQEQQSAAAPAADRAKTPTANAVREQRTQAPAPAAAPEPQPATAASTPPAPVQAEQTPAAEPPQPAPAIVPPTEQTSGPAEPAPTIDSTSGREQPSGDGAKQRGEGEAPIATGNPYAPEEAAPLATPTAGEGLPATPPAEAGQTQLPAP